VSQLASRLRTLRLDRGLTQQELAVKAGLAIVTVARLETKPRPDRPGSTNLSTLQKLARALDVPITDLVDGVTDETAGEPSSAA
jgi:transcriptional regulator with XRE-family HTH domain